MENLYERRKYAKMEMEKIKSNTRESESGSENESGAVSSEIDERFEANLERLRNFRLMDDDFFTKCFDGDTKCVELVLRIVMDKPDLVVLDVRTQVFVVNLLHRSVRLDVLATDGCGRKYNIEIQRADKGAGWKRACYNSSMLDANNLKKGAEFFDLPETYVIFITENDVIGRGLPVYHIERVIQETGEIFRDETHILYVNGAYRDNSPIGKLMHDFSCKEPDDMNYPVLAERATFFKKTKEGIEIMCKAMEDLWNQGVTEGVELGMEKKAVETAKLMLSDGEFTFDQIVKISGLSAQKVQELKEEALHAPEG